MKDSIKKQELEILNNFDFVKVHRVMSELDWTWNKNNKQFIPGVKELYEQVENLMDDAYINWLQNGKQPENSIISTGGFEVTYLPEDDDGPDGFSVKFVLEQWDNFNS